ncbi:hypothetical protein J2X20_005255 [Pelomonas saccharophila]|uniref:DUF333 domain-containing protein n=1 Tax=Roseateles saccharophilus TaxID=304 RepID=A0ABU1YUP9_ROSSA|nr:hypothetical protein [Roseateles saccharophilus]MDR7272572.1 hypothetical protein [Roseateles saccharophilus]
MKTVLRVSLLAVLAALAGCAAPVNKKACDAPQIQRELSYTPAGCEQTS